MEENKIKTGDVVWIKSGSATMTAGVIDERGACICVWFYQGEVREQSIGVDVLTNIKPDNVA